MRLFVLGVVALTACSSQPKFKLHAESCPTTFPDQGLTTLIADGGGKGAFDVDPPGPLERRAFGNYVLTSGDFVYTLSYDPAYYLTGTRVSGYGYAATNGDLDIEATYTDTDILGATDVYMVREQRTGCTTVRKTLDSTGSERTFTGTYTGNVLDYTKSYDIGYGDPLVWNGEIAADLSSTASADFNSGGLVYTADSTDDGAGNTRADWSQTQGGATDAGFDENATDGTWHERYTHNGSDGTYTTEVTVDYAGNGSGTYVEGSSTCSITYTAWACTYNCGSGSQSCG